MYPEKNSQQGCEDIKDKSAMYEDFAESHSEKAKNDFEESRSKKGKKAMWNSDNDAEEEAMDYEQHTKKDCPPRFSTLFVDKPTPIPAPVPAIHHYDEPRSRRRGGGIFLSWPAVILLGLLLFFETVALFAYTAIGLYNNMPSHLLTSHRDSTAALDIVGPAAQAPVNISPNFVIGAGEHITVTETVTMYLPTPQGMHAFESATSTAPADGGMAAVASDLRNLLRPSSSSSTSLPFPVVTVTPGGGTATSVIMVTHTVDPPASADRPTSFVTMFVAPSVLAAQQAAASAASKAEQVAKSEAASIASTTASSSSIASTTATSTTSSTSSTTSTEAATSSVPSSNGQKGTLGACFGGAGAVFQNCV